MPETITDFFDPLDMEHLKSYRYLKENGQWPEEFWAKIKDLDFQKGLWNVGVTAKMTDAYLKLMLE